MGESVCVLHVSRWNSTIKWGVSRLALVSRSRTCSMVLHADGCNKPVGNKSKLSANGICSGTQFQDRDDGHKIWDNVLGTYAPLPWTCQGKCHWGPLQHHLVPLSSNRCCWIRFWLPWNTTYPTSTSSLLIISPAVFCPRCCTHVSIFHAFPIFMHFCRPFFHSYCFCLPATICSSAFSLPALILATSVGSHQCPMFSIGERQYDINGLSATVKCGTDSAHAQRLSWLGLCTWFCSFLPERHCFQRGKWALVWMWTIWATMSWRCSLWLTYFFPLAICSRCCRQLHQFPENAPKSTHVCAISITAAYTTKLLENGASNSLQQWKPVPIAIIFSR